MSGTGNEAGARYTAARQQASAENRAKGLDIGWTVFSYLLSGMAAYGAIGWLVGRAVHVSLLFPLGMLVGLAVSIGFIIYRYGVHGATAQPQASAKAQKEMTGDR
jgi:F0F1-type ATP synthase assembly protein I